jgi:murein DD-endopeptidase MepM/ murein hydrolase activator NlpD
MDPRTFLPWIARAFALCGSLLCAAPAAAAIADYPFRVITRGIEGGVQVAAENHGPAPITVRVEVNGQGYTSDREWPATVVVEPYASVTLGGVVQDERPGVPFSARFNYSYHFGRLGAVHDMDAAYRLPFADGSGFAVSQAYGGRLSSHDNPANLYAIDFAMPAGSPVVAARAGLVLDVTLRYTEGGPDPAYLYKANTVSILHDDGTVAEYAHFSPGPAVVTAGERVPAGALLGYSGSTGYSSDPHLHFIVTEIVVRDGTVMHESVPVQFFGRDPSTRFSVQMGTTVWADYAPTLRLAVLRPRRAP